MSFVLALEFGHLLPLPTGEGKALKDADLSALGVGISHHFGGGSYVKETHIPEGATLAQHAHDHDHLSFLALGTVEVTVDGVSQEMTGPAAILMKAGKVHSVEAITPAVWLCIWATDCTDPEHVDEALLG
ncbi:cupin domain-containing protein [Variovorax paradoxus]|nr:cupin domain-containing protein [Variovorax paradoxus]